MSQHLLPPERDLPAARQALRRDHLMAEITRPRRQSFRLARWIAGITGVLVLAGGGYAVATNEVYGIDVACYESSDVHGSLAVVRAVDKGPVETCADVWREGAMKEGVHDAPPLVACVLETGPVGVFPGKPGTCERLGLEPVPEPTGEDRERAAATRKMVDDLSRRLGQRCFGKDEAVRIAREVFAEHGLTDWKVKTRPVIFDILKAIFGQRSPCVHMVAPVDEQNRIIVLD